ncbi:hypothetical protein [Microbacter margulisiae]|uniref:Uncharacterized protein n=1 Tax=Microbacter margulisiae TaxID=1350067 RepID=A0A7W5H156_9PORP|nr:hypothetical protein [Microbacter margulisiae]MBB3185991.1 hypothetical protein [Microbacter margulisiae]
MQNTSNKKKILILSANIYDTTSPRTMRTIELTTELIKQGHSVVLYSATENKSKNQAIQKSDNLSLKSYSSCNTKFSRSSVPFIRLLLNIVNRILDYLFLYPSIQYFIKVRKALKQEIGKQYDLLISVAVPHPIHWGCACVINQKTKPLLCNKWVADCGDPFMGSQTETISHPFYFKYIEKWSFRKADYISIPMATAKTGYFPEFWEKLVIIPQGVDFAKIKIYEKPIQNDVITFIYAGGFLANKREPAPFLQYIENQQYNFKFIVYTKCGGSNYFDHISSALRQKIEIHDYIKREELIYQMSKVDFLLNLENGTSVQMPSKLIDYALSMRPILSIDANNLNTKLIDEFFERNYTHQYNVENIAQYNIENVTKAFLSLCE